MPLLTEMYNNGDYNESLIKSFKYAVHKVKKYHTKKQMHKKANKSRDRHIKRKLIKDLGRRKGLKAWTTPMSFEF